MIKDQKNIEFKCIEIAQPIGSFYIGSILHTDLLRITYADVREIVDREMDKYLGIERPLSKGRVSELKKYVNLVDATFPTSIIIAVEPENCEFDRDNSIMRIKNEEDVAKIIDGQHRIAGLEDFEGPEFELNVTIFVEMDIEDQAMVFSTINLKHTKVSKSLMYDLFDYAKARSPQKTCHNIAKLLNTKDGSPFKHKIKILGTAERPMETLTQATFVDRLIKYISKDPMVDRDLLKRGKKPNRASEKEAHYQIFRNIFLDDKDAVIAKIVWNFYSAVSDKWSKAWKEVTKGRILNRSTGFAALIRFLRPAYLSVGRKEGDVVTADEFSNILKTVDLKDDDFNPENYKPGSSGEAQLYSDLMEKAGLQD